MRLYREQVVKLAVVVCLMAVLFTTASYLATQWNTVTYMNVDPDSMDPMMVTSRGIRYDDRAERVEITLSYSTDEEFDVYLVDDAEWNMTYAFLGPGPYLRHGIAGNEDVEWTVDADEFEGDLRLVEENSFYGRRGSMFNGTTVNYDWRITTRSVVDPLRSPFTILALALIATAAALLAWATSLPMEGVHEFSQLYPDFPGSLSTGRVGPRGG